jgi:anti-anti-sigma factor
MRMPDHDRRMQLAVEPVVDGVVAVRVAGELTAATGPRLLRLLDSLVERAGSGRPARRLLVDLANVRWFESDGVAVLRHVRRSGATGGVRLVVSGVEGHRFALPRRVDQALSEFDTVPTLEAATSRALASN